MKHFFKRKDIFFVLPLALFILMGCGEDNSGTGWDPPLMVMVDETVYLYKDSDNGKYRIDQEEILGYITSVVDGRPTQEGEASFPAAMGAAYGKFSTDEYADAVVMYWNNTWSLFLPSNLPSES